MRVNVLTLAAGLVLGGLAFSSPLSAQESSTGCATECSKSLQECPTAKKVKALLVRWDAVAANAKTVSLGDSKAGNELCAKLMKKCPIGCRMNDSLVAVRDVLGFAIASGAANAKNCPLEGEMGKTAACAEVKQMKAARTMALNMLHQLANHAADATSSKLVSKTNCETACSAAKDCDAKSDCEGKSDCATGECGSSASCPIRMAARLGELKAGVRESRRNAEKLTAADRRELLVGLATLAKTNKAVPLVPASVAALQEGFTGLNQIHLKMKAWAQANPQILAELPQSARQSFMMEVALIDEARQVLDGLEAAMNTIKPSEAKTAMIR